MAFWTNCVQSQTATLVLRDSSRYTGFMEDSAGKYIDFIRTGHTDSYAFSKKDIAYITNTDSLLARDKRNDIDLRLPPSAFFKRAGNYGVASVMMIIAGGITGIVGGIKGNKIATYTGASVSGAGFIFLIPAFVSIHNGAQALKEHDL